MHLFITFDGRRWRRSQQQQQPNMCCISVNFFLENVQILIILLKFFLFFFSHSHHRLAAKKRDIEWAKRMCCVWVVRNGCGATVSDHKFHFVLKAFANANEWASHHFAPMYARLHIVLRKSFFSVKINAKILFLIFFSEMQFQYINIFTLISNF